MSLGGTKDEHCYCFRQKHLLQNYFIFFQVNDDWHVTDVKDATSMKPAQIFVQGDLTWDQLQMLISKSTTADLLKVLTHLFFYSKPALICCALYTTRHLYTTYSYFKNHNIIY